MNIECVKLVNSRELVPNSKTLWESRGERKGRLLNVYILLLARVWWAKNTVGVQLDGAFLVLPPLCEWFCHEKSHMQKKEALIRGGKVTSLWKRFAEAFREICALNKGCDYKDFMVQMQIIWLETMDLETSWVMQSWYVSCWLGDREYKFDQHGWIHIASLFPMVVLHGGHQKWFLSWLY